MEGAQVRRLPVVDGDGRLTGVLSLADLARQAVRQQTKPTQSLAPADVAVTLAAITAARARRTLTAAPAALTRETRLLAGAIEAEC
jgi:CBS-domain-containing membrane protein